MFFHSEQKEKEKKNMNPISHYQMEISIGVVKPGLTTRTFTSTPTRIKHWMRVCEKLTTGIAIN